MTKTLTEFEEFVARVTSRLREVGLQVLVRYDSFDDRDDSLCQTKMSVVPVKRSRDQQDASGQVFLDVSLSRHWMGPPMYVAGTSATHRRRKDDDRTVYVPRTCVNTEENMEAVYAHLKTHYNL